jgi:N-6 DNA Methylase
MSFQLPRLLAEKINRAATRARGSELELQGEVDGYLREYLKAFGIDYDPEVNKHLQISDYSATGRPDSLFGHIVLDYKAPGVLKTAAGLRKAKNQVVEDYLNPACSRSGAFDPDEAEKWAGILLDGRSITFVTFNGVDEWAWAPLRDVSEYTVATLIQYYRALYRKPLDPRLLSRDFGRDTDVAKRCIKTFARYLDHPSTRTTMLFREWKRMFEQVSTYELEQLPSLEKWAKNLEISFHNDASLLLYCLHTYYALIVKLLAAELVTTSRQFGIASFFDRFANASGSRFKEELERLENGDVFRDLGITNFLEGDFFLWYLPHYDHELEVALRAIIDVFRTYEPATPKLNPNRCKDLLKVFYSSVIDEQLRHDLGEYYTPDWLGDYTLDRAGYHGQINATVLDPACGSGTFLVLAIQRLIATARARHLSSVEIVDRVRNQIKGFDLNPLAVISARTNYLLAIAEELSAYGGGIELPVYLCDCINIPTRKIVDQVRCLVYTLDTELGEREIALPEKLVASGTASEALLEAERCINRGDNSSAFLRRLRSIPRINPFLSDAEQQVLRNFFEIIQYFEEQEWDQIWCRIVKNHFASQTIHDVGYIVGNPPWVRWSRLPKNYRSRCKSFCNYYGLVSGRGYAGGIESDISTVITYSSIDNWLRSGGKLAFLITATVYKSDSATGFRKFKLPNGVPIIPLSIDDLVSLQPFPDATNETSLIVVQKGGARASH